METRKRLYGRQYELAHIYAPKEEGEYILSKRKELRDGKAYEVWQDLRKDDRMARNYDEHLRYQYLRGIFFALSTETPIYVVRTAGTVMHIPTNELEHEDGYREVECIELSLRVRLEAYQVPMVREMQAIVERKMRSFQTDFYLHDMRTVARELGRHPMLWVVGTSHTFMEEMDAEGDAAYWVENIDKPAVHDMVYGREDGTWMGAALRVAIGQEDLLYFVDAAGHLHKVSRERFERMHNEYVEKARTMAKEKLGLKNAA